MIELGDDLWVSPRRIVRTSCAANEEGRWDSGGQTHNQLAIR